jgi:hypothetical protein
MSRAGLKVAHTEPIPEVDKRPTKGTVISTLRKTLLSFAVVGIVGAVAGTGAFSAFSKTTSNDNNTITAGDVTITNDSPTTASYSLPAAKPGDSASRCIQVTFTGSLASTIKFYRGALAGNNGLESDVDLVITKGTGTSATCSDFAAAGTGSAIYTGTLNAMATTYAGGYSVLNRAGSAAWTNAGPNNVVTFKIQATLSSSTPNADQGKTTGTHSFTWEAQNN